MSIKFYCDIEGLSDNQIELSDKWTQSETKAAEEAMSGGWEVYLTALAPKVISCHLIVSDAILNDFADVTNEKLDMMDLRLVGFIGGILQNTTMRLRALGNASARVLSPLSDGKKFH